MYIPGKRLNESIAMQSVISQCTVVYVMSDAIVRILLGLVPCPFSPWMPITLLLLFFAGMDLAAWISDKRTK